MIRTSKHILKYQTKTKNNYLNELFLVYSHDLKLCLDELERNNYIVKKFDSFENGLIQHSAWKQIVYKNASEIIRSQLAEATKRRYEAYKKLYSKCKKLGKHQNFLSKKFKELNLKPVYKSKYFTKPNLENITITMDSRVVDFQKGNFFDEFICIKLPFFYYIKKKKLAIQICIPFKYHKHSLKFNSWERKKSIRLYKKNNYYMIELIYEKEDVPYNNKNKSLGIDQGYKKLLSCSDGKFYGKELVSLIEKITNKKKNSKNYKQLVHFKNTEINRIINIFLREHLEISDLYIEDLKNVKYKSKIKHNFMNKLQYWTYSSIIEKLERICEENGILLHYVKPNYTSQTCSKCGCVDKNSRNGESFICQHCGLIIDADYNASINILHRGIIDPLYQKT